jgi:lipopolysaccharide transport system ATP-binding protein
MSDIAIQIDSIGKCYTIGARQRGYHNYQTIRDTVSGFARGSLDFVKNGFRSGPAEETNEVWAVKNVSFEVKKGDVVGIIGSNGAGKSTLLKLLSRITEPTRGYANIYGRVGALLEVGTGFHAELTGRENLLLNGAILGMSRREILRKFDEIVDFAGC